MWAAAMLDGVLFFPVTPFGPDGEVDLVAFSTHVEERLSAGPGGMFVACGTGEFHALNADEHTRVVRRAVEIAAGRVPVFAGGGGPLPVAQSCARAAQGAGADGLLLLPPYLVPAPQAGLVAYARAVASAAPLPLILYSRDNAKYGVRASVELAAIPNVVGYKDGSGDVATMADVVSAVRTSLDGTGKAFWFFNVLPTAELTVLAYQAIGVERYSSAVFCFAPEISLAFYNAVIRGDTATADRLLSRFYRPFATLRDQVPGFAVSLVKAAVRLRGLDAGGVRSPLIDPSADQVAQLEEILGQGLAAVAAADA
jgi:5-dehydro-4-deoxyglucarate dehydratase